MSRKTKMNKITSPALLEQVNPKNRELLRDFLDYLRSIQRSETTCAAYQNDIEIAWVWCLQHNDNKFFVDWTKRNIVSYQNWLLSENGNSPARVRRLKASLSSLSNFIESVLDDEFENFRNIINKVESPILQPVREKTVLSEGEVNKILDTLVECQEYEKACLFALAVYGGRRKSELCRFRVSDFSDDKLVCDGALYKSDPIKTKGRGNGKYIPCYTLAKKFKPYLDLWMSYRDEHGIKNEYLFVIPSDHTKQLNTSAIDRWMNEFGKIVDRDIYAHSLRHYTCTAYLRSGLSEGVVQEIFGWSSAEMVKLYNDQSADELISMYFSGGDIVPVKSKNLNEI